MLKSKSAGASAEPGADNDSLRLEVFLATFASGFFLLEKEIIRSPFIGTFPEPSTVIMGKTLQPQRTLNRTFYSKLDMAGEEAIGVSPYLDPGS